MDKLLLCVGRIDEGNFPPGQIPNFTKEEIQTSIGKLGVESTVLFKHAFPDSTMFIVNLHVTNVHHIMYKV